MHKETLDSWSWNTCRRRVSAFYNENYNLSLGEIPGFILFYFMFIFCFSFLHKTTIGGALKLYRYKANTYTVFFQMPWMEGKFQMKIFHTEFVLLTLTSLTKKKKTSTTSVPYDTQLAPEQHKVKGDKPPHNWKSMHNFWPPRP